MTRISEDDLRNILVPYLATTWNPPLYGHPCEFAVKGRLKPDLVAFSFKIYNIFKKDIDKKYLLQFLFENRDKFELYGFEIKTRFDRRRIVSQISSYLNTGIFSRFYLVVLPRIQDRARDLIHNTFPNTGIGLITIDFYSTDVEIIEESNQLMITTLIKNVFFFDEKKVFAKMPKYSSPHIKHLITTKVRRDKGEICKFCTPADLATTFHSLMTTSLLDFQICNHCVLKNEEVVRLCTYHRKQCKICHLYFCKDHIEHHGCNSGGEIAISILPPFSPPSSSAQVVKIEKGKSRSPIRVINPLCYICNKRINSGEGTNCISCGNWFHHTCIKSRKNICPFCNSLIT